MLYIKKADRNKWIGALGLLKEQMRTGTVSTGELSYMITYLCHAYLKNKKETYQTHCEIEGVLQGASKEFYRILTTPYGDVKIKENGNLDE